jgi:hypothetical protein
MLTAEQKQRNRELKKQRVAYYKGLDEQRKKELTAKQAQAKREETLNSVTITVTDKERKLLNLALNPTSPKDEWQLAWIRFGESLRRRGAGSSRRSNNQPTNRKTAGP